MSRGSRRIGRVAGTTLLILLLAAWGRLFLVDGPLPDDGDFVVPTVPDLAPEENGWNRLREGASGIVPIDISAWFEGQPQSPLILPTGGFDFSKSEEWTGSGIAAAAHELIRTHEPESRLVDEILARPRAIVVLDETGDLAFYHVDALYDLTALLTFRIDVAILEGRSADAISDSLRVIALGAWLRCVENGFPIHRYSGGGVERVGLQRLLDTLDRSPAGAEELARIAEALAEPCDADRALEEAWRREYTTLREELLRIPRSTGFKPHRTLGAVLERRRAIVRSVRSPHPLSLPESSDAGQWDQILATLGGNGGGHVLLAQDGNAKGPIRQHDLSIFARRAATIAIALLRHRSREGSLLQSLDALVPHLLPALPLDPFTGGPILYDPEGAILWSPGSDGVDRGGRIPIAGEFIIEALEEPTLRIPGL